jgi:hypothetical protein
MLKCAPDYSTTSGAIADDFLLIIALSVRHGPFTQTDCKISKISFENIINLDFKSNIFDIRLQLEGRNCKFRALEYT